MYLHVVPVTAEELKSTDLTRVDCRYESSVTRHADKGNSLRVDIFPENDVFRPLMADPTIIGHQHMKQDVPTGHGRVFAYHGTTRHTKITNGPSADLSEAMITGERSGRHRR